jgi:KUP system potassium uptake protein
MVVLATAATVIASQAVISGAYSLTRQAIQLGYLPRMQHQAHLAATIGQIYIPGINWFLMIGTIATVLGFGSSTGWRQAYGVSVTGTMLITSVLFIVAMRHAGVAAALFWPLPAFFVLIDVTFLSANLAKFMDGAWFPIALGAGVFTCCAPGARARSAAAEILKESAVRSYRSCLA